ncbi:MAG: hypothetical protein ACRC2K_03445 [Clostridium sp.]
MKKVISFIIIFILTMGISIEATRVEAFEYTKMTLKSGETVEITNLEGIDLELTFDLPIMSNSFDIVKYKYNSNYGKYMVDDIKDREFLNIDNIYKGQQVITNNGGDEVVLTFPTKYAGKILKSDTKALDRYTISNGDTIEINFENGMKIGCENNVSIFKPKYDLVVVRGKTVNTIKRNCTEDLVFDYEECYNDTYIITAKVDTFISFAVPTKYSNNVVKTREQALTEIKVKDNETLKYNTYKTDNMIIYSENVKYDYVFYAFNRNGSSSYEDVYKMELFKEGSLNTYFYDQNYINIENCEISPYGVGEASFYVPTKFLYDFEVLSGSAVIRETLNNGQSLKVGKLDRKSQAKIIVEFLGRSGNGESKTYDTNCNVIDSFQGNRKQIINEMKSITKIKSNVNGAALAYPSRYKNFVTYEYDINYDELVDILDLAKLSEGYGSKANTEGKYNSNIDLTKDGAVDIYDIVAIAKCLE